MRSKFIAMLYGVSVMATVLVVTVGFLIKVTLLSPPSAQMSPAQVRAWGLKVGEATFTCDRLIMDTITAVQLAENSKGILSPYYGQALQTHCLKNILGTIPSSAADQTDIQGLVKGWKTINAEVKILELLYTTPRSGWDKLAIELGNL